MGVKKVYIIDEVHMLSTQAFNGLLKTIEEPPGHVLFVLATTEPHKVPATILSRCQRFTFRRVRDIDLIKRLEYICEQEKIEADKESLEAVLRLAGGGVRDAVSLLDKVISFSGSKVDYKIVAQVLGIVPAESQKKIFTALFKADYSSLVEELNNIESLGYDILRLSQELVHNTNTALLKVLSHVEPHAPFQMISLNDMVGLLEFLSRASAQASKMEDPFFHIRVELLKLASKFDSSGKSVFSAPEASARTHVSTHVDSAKPKSAQPENRVDEPDNSAQPENRVDEPDKTARAGSASQAGSAEPAKAGSASQAGSAEPAKAGSVSQAGAVEPVKTGLASPVSGLGISVTRENWDQLLGLVRKKDAVVHALLREGRPEIHGENLKIIFKKQHAFHQGQLSEERYLSTVRSAAAAVFEQAVSVSAHLEGDETEKKKLSEESLMEKALKDPRVKHLLDISGGKLIKVIPENKLNK
jgi:DNA polymerase-3 subunit gamma/tau